MNIARSLLASAAFGVIASSSAFAATSLNRPAQVPGPDSLAPIVVNVVHPTDLPRQYRDVSVKLEFTLDQNGKAHNVVPVGRMPSDLASHLIPAVSQWQFTPCRDARGNAVTKTVIMPLHLVDAY